MELEVSAPGSNHNQVSGALEDASVKFILRGSQPDVMLDVNPAIAGAGGGSFTTI